MRRGHRSVIAALLVALCCRTPAPIATAPSPVVPGPPAALQASTGRALVELDPSAPENGKLVVERIDAADAAAKLSISALSDAELQPLLARLEPLPAMTPAAPAMRPPSAAPVPSSPVAPIALVPLQGKQIADAAPAPPPPAPPPTPDAVGPLSPPPEILPSGEVDEASEVHVRFPEAMVPVAEVGVAKQAPATIAPAIAGSWRWIDTRVARFTATKRFPGASRFTVTVPAGIRALSGAALDKSITSSFSTASISLERVVMQQVRPDAPLLLELDQPFDAAMLAKHIRIEHAKKPLPFEVVTVAQAKEQWMRDPRFQLDKLKIPTHSLVLAPKPAWPAGSNLKVVLAAGATSSEGPLPTKQDAARDVVVVKPFTLRGVECANAADAKLDQKCPANSFMYVRFTNGVRRWRSDQVTIDSKIVAQQGGSYAIHILVPPDVGRRHAVEVAADLIDEYGQPLTGVRRAAFTTTPQTFSSYMRADSGVIILDPRFEIPQWRVEAAAIAALRIQLYRVEPADYFAFAKFDDTRRGRPPGTLVHDKQHP
ncbi:MAG: hypothetical protein H0V17_25280, partial [Deltaproteobacteria bacterium]|nr:hypothetical protein [Deltaproteobacteria bacterium]